MRSILITGASSGIGRQLSLDRAAAGDRVWATVRRPEDAADLVEASAGRVRPLLVDLRDPLAITGAAETVLEATGDDGLQALVNNAGIVCAGPLEELPLDHLRDQLEVNLIGPLAMSRALLPALRQGRGRILMVGSISGQLTLPFLAPYSLSKHGLSLLTRALRMELCPWQIPVCEIVLGNYRTPLWQKALSGAATEGRYARYLDRAHVIAADQEAAAGNVIDAVRAIARAIEVPRPRTIYRVGLAPRVIEVLVRLLPGAWLDRILCHVYHLSAPGESRGAKTPSEDPSGLGQSPPQSESR